MIGHKKKKKKKTHIHNCRFGFGLKFQLFFYYYYILQIKHLYFFGEKSKIQPMSSSLGNDKFILGIL